MRCTKEMPFFAYVAPYRNQAKTIVWRRLKRKLLPLIELNAVEIGESELKITFKHNHAEIRLFGADNPDAMRGLRLDGCVIDEVAQIKPEVWSEIIQPALSDRLGWALFIGTPKGINLFSELFYGAQGEKDWFRASYTVNDTQTIDPEEVKRLQADMSEKAFAREYLCDFEAASDDQLISMTDIEGATSRRYGEHDVLYAPKIIGVDPARFGNDRSVIFKRQGVQAFEPLVFHGLNNMELASRVAHVMQEWQADAVFIDSGGGAGVIDRLRQLGHDVIEVSFGGKASTSRYVNKRTEIWCAMKEWLCGGGAIPNRSGLKQELATPVYWFNANGQVCLESKEEIKKRLSGGASPDEADALALTFSHPVVSRHDMDMRNLQRRQRKEYNPYERNNQW
nr:terminase family protein [Bartonella queenslandensis]